MKQNHEKYCIECGSIINLKAEICPKCGVRQPFIAEMKQSNNKEDENQWLICLLLCWFVGILGAHRFYTGHIAIGIAQLLTLGGCGIWTLVDFILILTGKFKNSQGQILNRN
jgi:TM2 domain-containing membrane protein YozV/ribosomal protein S27AE